MGWQEKKKSCSICHCPLFVTTRSLDVGLGSLKPLFEFLAMPRKQKKNEFSSSWTMVELMHQMMMRASGSSSYTLYIIFNYDKVFIFDNQLWLFIQQFVVENYIRIPNFIYLDWMVTRSKSDTLTKVIMEVLIIGGGLP